ncbi:hypothetical protein [Vreelandella populi]|uniref:Uncharacterized protein n=1 Tax=Vreelandella populi TaxID=2498858 RepID=A0A3S0WQ10_9GAMM|nr:hypothetical protein [Halomonas populi]RUR48828.1 hypothetical protein ELY37_02970 [Halomonas populi]
MSDNERNLAPEVEQAISKLTVDDINDFLSNMLIPRHCHLCHGQLHVIVEYVPTDKGLIQNKDKPAILKLAIQETIVDGSSYAMELPCFTLGCLRCGNLNRLTVAPILDFMHNRESADAAANK